MVSKINQWINNTQASERVSENERAHTHSFTFRIVSLWYLYVDLHALVMVMPSQHISYAHNRSFSFSFSCSFSACIMLMLTLSTASFIQGVKACDFNHSFYSLVNTVWLGFCVLALPGNSTHTYGKIVRKYATHPTVQGEEKSFMVYFICPEIATTYIHVVIGLAIFGYYFSIPCGLLMLMLHPSPLCPSKGALVCITENFDTIVKSQPLGILLRAIWQNL